MADFRIAVGETTPAFQRTLKSDNVAVDLTGATVTFSLIKHGLAYIDNAATTAVTPASGIVKYVWQAGDLTDTGHYTATFKVVYPSTAIEYFEFTIEVIDGAGIVAPATPPAQDFATQVELDAHINDTTAAHAATAISNTPAGSIAATTVQAAIDELDTEKLEKASNLSDLANASTARTNLGLGTAAVTNTGTGATNTILGNDARLTDARTPTTHASSHASAGGDPITIAESQVTNLTTDLAAKAPLASPSFTGTITSAGDVSIGTNPASAGGVRLPNNIRINARNNANSGDITIARIGSTDIAIFGESAASIQFSASTTFVVTVAGVTNALQVRNAQAAAAGVGVGISLHGTTGNNTMAQIQSTWDGAATTDANLVFYLRSGNSANTAVLSFASTKDATFSGSVTMTDAKNLIVGSTTGTKIGTATSQKLGFWNATPVVQPTTAVTAAAFVANTSGIVNDTATFGGYTIGQIVAALKSIGVLA